MKKFTLKTIDNGGKVLSESNIKLDTSKHILIQKLPENITMESAIQVHRNLKKGLESGVNIITLHSGIELQVLEIQ